MPPTQDAPPLRPTGRRRDEWPWALAGLAAGAVDLGVAELVAGVLQPTSAPVVAVGDAFVDRVPAWLKAFAVEAFGTADKAVLLAGAGLVVALLAAAAGVLSRRRPLHAQWLVLALGAVAALAAATRPDAGMLSVLPATLGALAGVLALGRLTRVGDAVVPVVPAGAGPPEDRPLPHAGSPSGSGPGRRRFLVASAVAAAAGLVTAAAGRAAAGVLHAADASRAALQLPAPAARAVLPAGVEVGVPGVVPFRVPNPDFYRIDTALVVPSVRSEAWRLRIHGMVEQEVELDLQQLLREPLIERDLTLICVSNEVGGGLVGNARWLGTRIGPLLQRARPLPGADMVLSTSADGWTASTPLDVLTDERDALFAVGMNGEPLPVEHGFPVRMVVPGLYGYVSATKWVVDLEVTRFDRAEAYWTPRGWSERGPVKTQSRIDVPRAGASVPAGRVAVAGIAWAQTRGIRAVEVRVDGGPWRPARLAAVPGVDTWRQWVLDWDAAPGPHTLQVRAVDGLGAVQTGDQAPVAPDGATGWHTVEVQVS